MRRGYLQALLRRSLMAPSIDWRVEDTVTRNAASIAFLTMTIVSDLWTGAAQLLDERTRDRLDSLLGYHQAQVDDQQALV